MAACHGAHAAAVRARIHLFAALDLFRFAGGICAEGRGAFLQGSYHYYYYYYDSLQQQHCHTDTQ